MSLENYKIKNGILILGLVFLFFASGFYFRINAQTNSQIIITWQAQDFAPAGYQGKILPSPGANIKLSLELVTQNKLQNLSKADILWYLDGKLLDRGQGLKETDFVVSKSAGYSHFVRTVINYNQQAYEGNINMVIASPKIVIKTPSPANSSIPLGKNIFIAIPYFFNATNLQQLIFNWSANGQTVQGNNILGGNILELDVVPPIPIDQNLNIKVIIQNSNNDLEFGSEEINLNIK